MRVQLTRDWKHYQDGDILTVQDRPPYVLQMLLDVGYGVRVYPEPPQRLPDDVPERELLEAAGLLSLKALMELYHADALETIEGVGSQKALQIGAYCDGLS